MNAAIKPIEHVKPDAVEEALNAVKEALTSDDVASIRKCCDWLARWRHCGAPACKRAHACTGDAAQCFGRFYFACPEHLLVWVHVGIMAVDEGCTARVATRLADGALLASLKAKARLPLSLRTSRKRPVQATSAPSPRSAARRASPCAAPPATS